MPAQLTLRSTKGGRVIAEREYPDGHRIDATSGWLVVVDRNGSVIAAHAACPGLEGRLVEHASAAAPYPAGETATYPTDDGIALDEAEEDDAPGLPHGDEVEHYCPTCQRRVAVPIAEPGSDGHLDDAERWQPDPRLDASPEVVALMRLDRILGEERALSEVGTGRVRRVVFGALRAWHKRQPDLDEPAKQRTAPRFTHEGDEPLDEQVGRLADWIMENVDEEPSQPQGAVDTAIRLLDGLLATRKVYREEVEEQTARAEREHAMRLSSEQTNTHLREKLRAIEREREEAQANLALYRKRLGATLVDDAAPQPRPDRSLLAGGHRPGDPIPVEDDPRRPHPDAWPDDAVLLRYRELRRLVSIHLDRYGASADAVRAMIDGDVPLRVSEVLA